MKRKNWLLIPLIACCCTGMSVSCKTKKKDPSVQENKTDADSPLRQSVNNVVSTYSGVTAEVNDGVVTLKGTINRDDLQGLIMKIQELNPRRVENLLVIK